MNTGTAEVSGGTVGLAEAAQQLGCSWNVAFRYLLEGRLLGQKLNGRWRVEARSVDRLSAERRKQEQVS